MIDKQSYYDHLKRLDQLKAERQIRMARESFWHYCKLDSPDFYDDGKEYLRIIAHEMQDFYFSDEHVMIINLPPRHGKSRTAGKFVEWLLGRNPKLKVMTGSYNELLSTTFSKGVRNTIQEEKADSERVVYRDIFPDTRIKYGDGASNLWGLEGGHYNYLATSPNGTATGFGADVLLVDDLIKNAEEAYNERVLEKHWDWFTQTMLSRLQEGGKVIIVMTRWAMGDLAGRAKAYYESQGTKVREIKMKALQDDGTMLSDEVLSYESYQNKIHAMGEEIASANYQQEPIDVKGRLYTNLKTYEKRVKYKRIINYTDTADTGKDFHCSIVAGETFDGELQVLDVIYTRDSMEYTEPLQTKQLYEHDVNIAWIESNSGGRGFARNIERLLWEKYRTRRTAVKWFHQSKNKKARILSNATYVMDHIYFPENWKDKWPEFYRDLIKYQKDSTNQADDGPDALTGLAEYMSERMPALISGTSAWG